MSLTAAMNIGRTALSASQAAIQVVGNNIANAATPGYSRQLVSLAPIPGQRVGSSTLGLGVSLTGVRRQVDVALQGRMWTSYGQEGAAGERLAMLSTLETSLNELTGHDLSTQLTQFFGAWSERANLTKSSAVVVQQGAQIASFLRGLRADLSRQRDQVDGQLSDYAGAADHLVRTIAELNRQIPPAEVGGGVANELRDRRDVLLGELSALMDITAVDQGDGTVHVLVGSTPVVLGGTARSITLDRRSVGGSLEVRVMVGEDGRELAVGGGRLGALLTGRSDAIDATIRTLDAMSASLIHEVNRIHSTGAARPGLESALGTLSIGVEDRARAMNDAASGVFSGLPFAPGHGSFFVEVTDRATGTMRRVRIEVDLDGINASGRRGTEDDTTPEGLRAAIHAIPGVRASFDSGGRLRVESDEGFEFNFADDTSGVLAVLGVNAYFTGTDARTIGVRESLLEEPQRLMVGRGSGSGYTENGTAMAIAALRDTALESLGGRSLTQRWQDEVQSVATQAGAAAIATQGAMIVRESLQAQQAAVSGVSIDEEAINLTNFQRQYQGAARVIAVADQLLQELLRLV